MNNRLSKNRCTMVFVLAAISLLILSGCASKSASVSPGVVEQSTAAANPGQLTPAQEKTISDAKTAAAALDKLKAAHPGP